MGQVKDKVGVKTMGGFGRVRVQNTGIFVGAYVKSMDVLIKGIGITVEESNRIFSGMLILFFLQTVFN